MPQFGQRLTGMVGSWALGLLNMEDRKPDSSCDKIRGNTGRAHVSM